MSATDQETQLSKKEEAAPVELAMTEAETTATVPPPTNLTGEALSTPPGFLLKKQGESLHIIRQTMLEQGELPEFLSLLFLLLFFLLGVGATGYALYAVLAIHSLWSVGMVIGAFITWFLYETMAELFINRRIIELTPTEFRIAYKPLPSLLGRHRFPREVIKQVYSENVQATKKTGQPPSYRLYLVTQKGHHKLLTAISPYEVLFLERTIEQYFGLDDSPIVDEAGKIIQTRIAKAFFGWEALAATYGLDFSNDGINLSVTGRYRACHLEMNASPESEWSDQMAMRVTMQSDATADDKNEIVADAEAIRQLLDVPQHFTLADDLKIDPQERRLIYTLTPPETNIHTLESLLGFLCRLLTLYPALIKLGSPAMPALLDLAAQPSHHALQSVARRLLLDIAEETTARLQPQVDQLLCAVCFRRCTAHRLELSWRAPLTYYACRHCRQSQDFLATGQGVVAVLDGTSTDTLIETDDHLRINWLHHRHLFDFDAVEIINASDEAVERFAVQVGNDTDPLRQPRYAKMAVTIAPDSTISKNSRRIVARTFGQVTVSRIKSPDSAQSERRSARYAPDNAYRHSDQSTATPDDLDTRESGAGR